MTETEHQKHIIHPERFTVLAPVTPFVDVILQNIPTSLAEYQKIAEIAGNYPNDPRLIEMVRKAGDASAKVPYLMNSGETPENVLEILRGVAEPQVRYLKKLPEAMQATIHTLLSINMVPRGCEAYGIPALLEIDRMQKAMTAELRGLMEGRALAKEFHDDNRKALEVLDQHWSEVRKKRHSPWPFSQSLPESPRMQFVPIQFKKIVVAMREVCVIVDAPDAAELREITPPVLQNPLPEDVDAPVTGSADWLLRVSGKIGRHFTRALLDIIKRHLEAERISSNLVSYERINLEAQDALRSFIQSNP